MRFSQFIPVRFVTSMKTKVTQHRLYQQNAEIVGQVRASVSKHEVRFVVFVTLVAIPCFWIYLSGFMAALGELDGSVCPLGPMELCALTALILLPIYAAIAVGASSMMGAVTGYMIVIVLYFLYRKPFAVKMSSAVKRTIKRCFCRA